MTSPPVDAALIAEAVRFHPWDAMSPAALAAIAELGPFDASAETGCGGSTIVLSHCARRHTAFAIEGENATISTLRRQRALAVERVTFVEGETRNTVPGHDFRAPLDFVLLDGPHAYPLPQIEYAYLAPNLRIGGWLAVDDIQIPSVHELFRFLAEEPSWELDRVSVRTAFFRRKSNRSGGPDDWAAQGMNRRPVLRYAWRDWARKWLRRQ
ncbi:MAG: class I SAM-dependent methyltransferase [Bryobacteraceae bacterium]